MNHDLKLLTLEELFELMMEQTSYHTQLMSLGATSKQFQVSRETLLNFQAEIELRKSTPEPRQNTISQDPSPSEVQSSG